jgi:hypothetical protein
MRVKTISVVLALCCLALVPIAAQATVFDFVAMNPTPGGTNGGFNPGFEDPALAAPGESTSLADCWTWSAGATTGVHRPASPDDPTYPQPHGGNQYAFTESNGTYTTTEIRQPMRSSSAWYMPNPCLGGLMTFTVYQSKAVGAGPQHFRMVLWESSTTSANWSTRRVANQFDFGDAPEKQWVARTLTYAPLAGDTTTGDAHRVYWIQLSAVTLDPLDPSTYSSRVLLDDVSGSYDDSIMHGDANADHTVDGADLNTVLSNYNQSGMNWYQGDFNNDKTVDGNDLNVVLSNYNLHSPVTAAVPEPSTLLLAGAGLTGLLAYAWRKRR